MRNLAWALAVVAPCAYGQTLPPDVPQGHWAATAVENLYRLGILNGYPAQKFTGSRPVSRYELAVSLDRLYNLEHRLTNSMEEQFSPTKAPAYAAAADLGRLRAQFESTQQNLISLEAERPEEDSINSRFAEMNNELTRLHEELKAMHQKATELKHRMVKDQ